MEKTKISWGVMSSAKIAVEKVIPAMQKGKYSKVVAIASRDIERARSAASKLKIAKAFGSYEELLKDPEINAIYIPLPNHLHIPWSIKALEAGKHVLCEKPIGLSAEQAQQLLSASRKYPHLKIMEAFMYRFHPQWQETKRIVEGQIVGEIKSINSYFSYFNIDPDNIRNKREMGGGGLLDIGCYNISLSRFLLNSEPKRVLGKVEYDPVFKVDRQTSGILDFGSVCSTFTCGTQMAPYQRVNVVGTKGRIEIDIPFNAPSDQCTRIWLYEGSDCKEIVFELCDQYTLQGDLFSLSILNDVPVPPPLKDAVNNMKVIEAVVKSSQTNSWITIN